MLTPVFDVDSVRTHIGRYEADSVGTVSAVDNLCICYISTGAGHLGCHFLNPCVTWKGDSNLTRAVGGGVFLVAGGEGDVVQHNTFLQNCTEATQSISSQEGLKYISERVTAELRALLYVNLTFSLATVSLADFGAFCTRVHVATACEGTS